MIEISLNNEKRSLATNTSVATALTDWGYGEQTAIAIAINHAFVPRQNYSKTILNDQDQVDIVQPISGG